MKNTNNKNNMYQQMLAMVQNAIQIIQEEAAVFSQKTKTHYSGTEDDLVTSADIKAQAMYVEAIQANFPNDGLIGEENGLNIKPKKGYGYFTVDPLDGTKAFGRTQSTGCGTMIAHVDANNIVDAMCIGDINTGEIYGFGPEDLPTRIRFGVKTLMKINAATPLENRYILLKDHQEEYPAVIQKMSRAKNGGLFKDIEITSGSIGLIMARLWKNEVAVLILRANGFDTPWDNTPLIGMNKALGIVHLRLDIKTNHIEVFDPEIPKDVIERDWVEILTHKDYAAQIINWIKTNK